MGSKKKALDTKGLWYCVECGNESRGWLGKCPVCGAWNSFVEAPRDIVDPVVLQAAQLDQAAHLVKASKSDQGSVKALPTPTLGTSWVNDSQETQGVSLTNLEMPILSDSRGSEDAQVAQNSQDSEDGPVSQNTNGPRPSRPQLSGAEARISTRMSEFDRVLGGGLVPGSLVLLTGNPGIGKSTLLLQTAAQVGQALYATGEESAFQIQVRARRLGLSSARVHLLTTLNVGILEQVCEHLRPSLIICDSIQTAYDPDLEAGAGSPSQLKAATSRLLRLAKNRGISIILVGHVTKDGMVAGPKLLEHMVDCVLTFEGEAHEALRVLRATKNRFGSLEEAGLFQMGDQGLLTVDDPAAILTPNQPLQVPGVCLTTMMEGSRALVLELQALLTDSQFNQPLRNSQGIDRMRVTMLLAILEKHLHVHVTDQDAYVNVTAGMKLKEPAADLAVAAAMLSSYRSQAVRQNLILLGELGLAGELRAISFPGRRVKEAVRLGFQAFVLPKGNQNALKKDRPLMTFLAEKGVELHFASLLQDALGSMFP